MVQYRVLYRDSFNQLCRIDILHDSYTGDPIPLRGVGGQACVINRDCDDDPYIAIVNTKATISVYVETPGQVNILQLQEAQDREFRVEFYIENVLKFSGFMIPDGIQGYIKFSPFTLTLNATDGLMLLDGIPYVHNNLTGGRNIINYMRQILFAPTNLNLPLPIRWVNNIKNMYYPQEDVMSGSLLWSSRGEGYTDYQGNYKSCLYILENMLLSMQCRIVQDEGRWVIWRINDLVTGNIIYKEIAATLVGFNVTTLGVQSLVKLVADGAETPDYQIYNDDPVTRIKPGLKTVVTTYEQDQRDNILPNGNMDIMTFGSPLYWNLVNPAIASVTAAPSLSANRGNSVRVANNLGIGSNIFKMSAGSLPIDTDILYTFINFGFKFSIESGAIVDPDGYIQWEEDKARWNLQVIYNAGTKTYYLNEFGFWTEKFTLIYPMISMLKQGDVAQLDFNAHQDIIIPLPPQTPIGQTNTPAIYVGFNLQPGIVIVLDDIYMNTNQNSDVYEATNYSTTSTASEEYTLHISSAHSGFYVSNYMSIYANSGQEKFFNDGKYTGTLTEINSHAILRNRYKTSLMVDSTWKGKKYSYAEIYNIKTLEGKNFLPLKTTWNTETNTIETTLIEIRDDGTSISVKHYGSNNKTLLSN